MPASGVSTFLEDNEFDQHRPIADSLRSLRLCVFASDVDWLGMTENAMAREIVDVAFRVHTGLGPGLFESVYEAILANQFEKRGLHV